MHGRPIPLDVWLARNLGFIAGMLVIAGVVVWPLIFWIYPFSVESLFCLLGLFLFICYWRYPRLPFHTPPLLFWIGSLALIPGWVLLRLAVLRDITNSPLGGYLLAGVVVARLHTSHYRSSVLSFIFTISCGRRPDHTMQPTASPRTASLSMINTHLFQFSLAAISGG
jgi:hypothetical protein